MSYRFLSLLTLAAGCATQGAPAMRSADDVLAGQQTRYELSRAFDTPHPSCAAGREGFEICLYRAGADAPAYGKLARLLNTNGKVSVLCELPLTDANKLGTCTAHRSEEQAELSDGKRERKTLTKLHTALDVSRYLGQAPELCVMRSDSTLQCTWTAEPTTPGYAKTMLAQQADEPGATSASALRLLCRLPLDGSPRAEESCSAGQVGRHASQYNF